MATVRKMYFNHSEVERVFQPVTTFLDPLYGSDQDYLVFGTQDAHFSIVFLKAAPNFLNRSSWPVRFCIRFLDKTNLNRKLGPLPGAYDKLQILAVSDFFVSPNGRNLDINNAVGNHMFEGKEWLRNVTLFSDDWCPDLAIQVGNQEFKVHFFVLAQHIPKLRCFVKVGYRCGPYIGVADFDCATVFAALVFIYLGSVREVEENAGAVLKFAFKYEIRSLMDYCTDYLSSSLCSQNIFCISYLAFACEREGLLLVCGQFLSNHVDLFKLYEWEDFSRKNPEAAIQLQKYAMLHSLERKTV